MCLVEYDEIKEPLLVLALPVVDLLQAERLAHGLVSNGDVESRTFVLVLVTFTRDGAPAYE